MRPPRQATKIPEAVLQLAGAFYPGSLEEYPNYEAWIADALGSQTESDKKIIKEFLDELLDGQHSDEELQKIWRRMGPGYEFSAGGHRLFFTELRDLLSRDQAERPERRAE